MAKQTSSPREVEANLLLKAASRLQTIHDTWDISRPELDDALLYNRKLWSIFLTTVVDESNPLPPEVRQNVANIGIFVMNQTLDTINNPRPEQLSSLIKINRELAAGLLAQA